MQYIGLVPDGQHGVNYDDDSYSDYVARQAMLTAWDLRDKAESDWLDVAGTAA